MLHKFLHQKRFPWFTAISILTTLLVWAAVIAFCSSRRVGFEALGLGLLTEFAVALGLVLNIVWGLLAYSRGEYCGGRIATAGIALPLALLLGWRAVSESLSYHPAEVTEHSRMWGQIDEVFVQPDGKLVLIGSGLVRLLPDGQPDPSFHRDYSFARRGSLPDPIRDRWPIDACAALAPYGDLILADNGWIDRVRADGRDTPVLVNGLSGWTTCWGLAVQSDGKILVGWSGYHFSRLLPGGGVDPSFRPAVVPLGPAGGKVAIQADGKIVLVGETQQAGSGCFNRLLRLNADGSLDGTFGSGQPCLPMSLSGLRFADLIATLPDGSMLVRMGSFEYGSTDELMYLDRDGKTLENPGLLHALHPLAPRIRGFTPVVPMSDGRILVVHDGLVRVLKDGARDSTFQAYGIESDSILKVLIQGEKIIVLDRSGKLVRLNGDGSLDSSFRMPALRVYSD